MNYWVLGVARFNFVLAALCRGVEGRAAPVWKREPLLTLTHVLFCPCGVLCVCVFLWSLLGVLVGGKQARESV